jgi:hypothetical protein
MNRTPGQNGFHSRDDRTFSRPGSMNRQNGMNLQRPSPGEIRSFSPPSHGPSRGIERSLSPSPQGGGQHFGSSHTGSRGFSESRQGGDRGSSFGRGGSHF